MKIGEARGNYSAQLREYNAQIIKLTEKKQKLDDKIKTTENGSIVYANESVTLELSYNAVSEKQDEYQNYMNQLMEQWSARFNMEVSEQQADAAEEYGKEMSKIMTVARRIIRGDIVPATDEKKLMEYDGKLYQMAKNAGMMAKLREKKKYESLWEDEGKNDYSDPTEVADQEEAFASGPDMISVEDTIDIATEGVAEVVDIEYNNL